jgi:hypothetical protein
MYVCVYMCICIHVTYARESEIHTTYTCDQRSRTCSKVLVLGPCFEEGGEREERETGERWAEGTSSVEGMYAWKRHLSLSFFLSFSLAHAHTRTHMYTHTHTHLVCTHLSLTLCFSLSPSLPVSSCLKRDLFKGEWS